MIEDSRILELILCYWVDSDKTLNHLRVNLNCREMKILLNSKAVLNRMHRGMFLREWPLFSVPKNKNEVDWQKLRKQRQRFKYYLSLQEAEKAPRSNYRTRFVAIEECHHSQFKEFEASHITTMGTQVDFAFRCPLQADELRDVGSNVAFCDHCQEHVHFVNTMEDFQRHTDQGHCVSLEVVDVSSKIKRPTRPTYRGRVLEF